MVQNTGDMNFYSRVKRLLIVCTLHLSLHGISYSQSACIPVDLQCENLIDPLGIDVFSPRLSWRLDDKRTGAIQSAHQIFIGTDSLQVINGKGTIWQTGKINSSTQAVIYSGKTLSPFTKYYWSVRVWDKDLKPSRLAKPGSFETGIMEMKNWKGSWISDTRDIHLKPAPYFRKVFTANKKIKSARAYIAVAGLYELSVNGQIISNHRLDPMYTRFDRRNLYVTHDITSQLQEGKNAIGVLLGNGWYNHQSTAVWYFHEAPWRARPAFCMDVRIVYEDGTTETIGTGKDWKTSLSPVIFNSIYTAEHYDSRLEQPGWSTTAFNDSAWKQVEYRAAPSTNITAQVLHPIRNVEKIVPRSVNKLSDTVYVFDLGRNISGVSEITVTGEAGTTIRLKHGERIYKNGRVDQSNIDVHYRPVGNEDPFQTDIFILNGKGEQTFMPRFNYKGFQYIEVTSDKPVRLDNKSLSGYFMHSDVPSVGTIKSSDSLLNKLWWATNNSYLANLFGYPTDCPQREKNGWTGDAHIASETGLYNFDAISIYEKWMADHRDEQQANGVLPSIIPTGGWGYEWGNGPDWTSTIAIIPWNIYLFYGDSKLLLDCYDNIKKYVDHITDISPSGLTTWGLGDWIPVKSQTPVEFTSSVYYFADATILSKAAKLFGKNADHEKYSKLANTIRNAINKKYLDETTGIYGSGFQTELSVPLQWGVVPDRLKSKVAANLAKRVEADNDHVDVGLLGSKAILNALSENGYAGLAYKVASQDTYPSWGWWIKRGATTLTENWNLDVAHDVSLNHIMFGEIGAWYYKALGGIKPDPAQPGFKNILLEPHFVNGLDHFEATHKGPYGVIVSSWRRLPDQIIYTVIIPPNSTATLRLSLTADQRLYKNGQLIKGTTVHQLLKAGEYKFEIKW